MKAVHGQSKADSHAECSRLTEDGWPWGAHEPRPDSVLRKALGPEQRPRKDVQAEAAKGIKTECEM